MEKKNSWLVVAIVILAIATITLYTKNKKLNNEVIQWQDEYSSSEADLRSLKDEHETLTSEHDEFKTCVEEHVYYQNYNDMRSTYNDCF